MFACFSSASGLSSSEDESVFSSFRILLYATGSDLESPILILKAPCRVRKQTGTCCHRVWPPTLTWFMPSEVPAEYFERTGPSAAGSSASETSPNIHETGLWTRDDDLAFKVYKISNRTLATLSGGSKVKKSLLEVFARMGILQKSSWKMVLTQVAINSVNAWGSIKCRSTMPVQLLFNSWVRTKKGCKESGSSMSGCSIAGCHFSEHVDTAEPCLHIGQPTCLHPRESQKSVIGVYFLMAADI